MSLIQKIINKFKKKEVTVVTTRDLAKHMQETRTIKVPNYKETKIITTHTLGKNILETGKVPTPVYTKSREYDSDVSMFH